METVGSLARPYCGYKDAAACIVVAVASAVVVAAVVIKPQGF
jgi:hypothetical protein